MFVSRAGLPESEKPAVVQRKSCGLVEEVLTGTASFVSTDCTHDKQENRLFLTSASKMGHFAVADRRNVPAADRELHDLDALPRQFRPARDGGGVLLESSDALSHILKIHLIH